MRPRKGPVVITGASSDIGSAIAKELAAEGYPVILGYWRNKRRVDLLEAEIIKLGVAVQTVEANLLDQQHIHNLFEIADKFGRLKGLVNAAALSGKQRNFLELPINEIEHIWKLNFLGTLCCCKEAVKRMSLDHGGTGGRIVNLSSQAARSGGYRRIAYAASKLGVEGLTVSLASELGDQGIVVVALAPGLIETTQQPLDDHGWVSRARNSIPLGRLGKPEEVASLTAWLMTSGANYISGITIPITGGRRA